MLKTFSKTDIGRKRKINQDCIFSCEVPLGNLPNLFIVADGMGGHNAGDYASSYTVKAIEREVMINESTEPVKIIKEAIECANAEIFRKAEAEKDFQGMGTTAVVATIVDDIMYVANVGDSRLYVAGGSDLTQVTQDHSLIAEMVRLGELTPEEGRHHPDKNIITRAIGTSEEVRIDFFDMKLERGNQILMCSDGLTNMVGDDRIFEILRGRDTDDVAQTLVDEANLNGGRDNIAVIVVEP